MSDSINRKVTVATKWSALTEILAKLLTPVSTMILARILAPDAFGVLVMVTMVITFAQIFADAGFQKYLVQRNFESDAALYRSAAVAFWANLIFSLLLWGIIVLFSQQIAHQAGNDGYGFVISVSCVCLPLVAFSSIQMALFRRALDFRTLFWVRLVGILIPLVVTIPLAYLTRSYWSLVIGMIALELSNAVLLTARSEWKPRWFFDKVLFREMFSFSAWSMIESVSIWLTNYLDAFVVGSVLSNYYVGIYRTSINTVGQIMALVTATTTPVLFSALSRLQDDRTEFRRMFFNFQKTVGMLVIPFGVGIFLFSDLITSVLLGGQWMEASFFIGWWGLTSSVTIVLSHYCSEVYRAYGKPKLSVLVQFLHLVVLIPVVLYTVRLGFDTLCVSRALVRFQMIIVNLAVLYWLTKITPAEMFRNICAPLLAAVAMVVVFAFMPENCEWGMQICFAVVCMLAYIAVILLFPAERSILFNLSRMIRTR